MTEKEKLPKEDVAYDSNGSHDHDFEANAPPASGGLARNLQGRHMQMIAIGMFSLIVQALCYFLALWKEWVGNEPCEQRPTEANVSILFTRWINWCWSFRGLRWSFE